MIVMLLDRGFISVVMKYDGVFEKELIVETLLIFFPDW